MTGKVDPVKLLLYRTFSSRMRDAYAVRTSGLREYGPDYRDSARAEREIAGSISQTETEPARGFGFVQTRSGWKLPIMSKATRLINACRDRPVDATPVWLMRQAGRYMPEYRALRKEYTILDLIRNPELATRVTLQPIHAFDVDAAIIFSDLLIPLEGMGLEIDFIAGEGPVIYNPVRSSEDVERLAVPPAEEALCATLKAITMVAAELNQSLPIIGFAGGPFTMATYAIEGGPSRNFLLVKEFMYRNSTDWQKFMGKLAEFVSDFLCAQISAGAAVVQIFDSWIGILSPIDFEQYARPYLHRVIDSVRAKHRDVPIIYFGTCATGLLEGIKDLGCDVVGLDWRIDISAAASILGPGIALQGNLDPATLYASEPIIKERAAAILDQVRDRNNYIFNLGHGVLKDTPVEHVAALIDFVHNYDPNYISKT